MALTQVHCPANLGAITSVRLRIDGRDQWNVHSVSVHDYFNDGGHVTHFVCDCWLDSGAGAVGPSTRLLQNTFRGKATLKFLFNFVYICTALVKIYPSKSNAF